MLSKRYIVFLILLLFNIDSNSAIGESDILTINQNLATKITFDINNINEQGLSGPPGGLVSIDYEFCIPANKSYVEEVKKIDATVMVYESSSGRIGCSQDEYLCVGNTHQRNFKVVLYKLAGLSYVNRIDRCYWE